MIYGHEFDRGWSTRGLVTCVAVGTALGVGLGLLFAPSAGAHARRSVGDAAHRLRERLQRARSQARPLEGRVDAPPAMLE